MNGIGKANPTDIFDAPSFIELLLEMCQCSSPKVPLIMICRGLELIAREMFLKDDWKSPDTLATSLDSCLAILKALHKVANIEVAWPLLCVVSGRSFIQFRKRDTREGCRGPLNDIGW